MRRLKKGCLTILLLLVAQIILVTFQCQFNLQDVWYYTYNYWHNYIFDLILLYVLYLAFLVLFNRNTYAWFCFFSTILLFSMANYLKLSYRSEPLLPSDFSMIFELNQIIRMINEVHMITSVIVIALLFVFFLLLKKIKSKPIFTSIQRILLAVVMLLLFYSFFNSNHTNNPYKVIASSFGITDNYWDLAEDYSSNGPIAGFIKNLDIQVMEEEPADYSYDAIKEIVTKYKGKLKEANSPTNTLEDHTVIFILSESFVDPLRIPSLELSDDPIPFIRSLKNETTSGLMLGSNYGGGTANVEYEVLTGFSTNYFHRSLLIPYTLLVPNLNEVPNFTNLFKQKIAVHSYNANLYRRKEVFEKFGFETFIYEGGNPDLTYKERKEDGHYISDESAYQEVLDFVNNEKDGNLFIQLTTMQNHGPYEKNQYENQFEVLNELNEDVKLRIETYIQGLYYTDLATQNFIENIEAIDKSITVLFFGDHLPSEVFEHFDERNGEDLEFYETDYFIYSNFETDTLDYPVVSPNNMSSIVHEQLNVQSTPYTILLDELKRTLPVIRWGGYLYEPNEEYVFEDELPESARELVEDYRMIQYDINAGEQYAVELGMFDFQE